jgi:hypothetical protein
VDLTYTWTARVRAESRKASRIHTRNHTFRVGPSLSFEPTDELPSALEHLLGALAADLLHTFQVYARRARIPIDALELSLTCRLENPLVHLGVLGEEGSPRLEAIEGVFYASADAGAEALDRLWQETLKRAPIYATLERACPLTIRFAPTP